jgi:hypothetical protein
MKLIRSAFRTVRENPALIFAEIAWRWTFGAIAWLLMLFTVRTIFQNIDVSGAEVAIARSNNAYLIADAVVRILVQVLPRVGAALLLIVPLLSLVWTVVATIGRAATLRSLIPSAGRHIAPLFFLNLIRAFFTVATFLAFFGTILFVSSQLAPSPDAAPALVLGWMFLAFLVTIFWGFVNWFLALAPIFIVRDGIGARKAISESLGLYRSNSRDYMAIATGFGLFRTAALMVAIIAGAVTVGAGSIRGVLIASVVVALVYFAVADWLYIARLAAYVELANVPVLDGSPATVSPASSVPVAESPHLELET